MGFSIDELRKRERGVKKKPEELRKRVSLSFSRDEFVKLDGLAEEYNLSRSEFVRCVVFGGLDKVARKIARIQVSEHDKQLKRTLDGIANNLNQIAQKIHIDHEDGQSIDETVRLVNAIRNHLKGKS